jgi:murein DD-endopeptidase MepM/ murein hydrolase activator NlpD
MALVNIDMAKVEPKPFLHMPFAKRFGTEISEGWIYSEEEQNIHHHKIHFAIDFKLKMKTPVRSPIDGYAVGYYQSSYLDMLYKEKRVGYGLGFFIEIWSPDAGVFVSLCHLDSIWIDIPYQEPKKRYSSGYDTWDPITIYNSLEEKLKVATVVKKGDIIGYSGSTGLAWGFQEGPRCKPNAAPALESWDEPHLHLEVYTRKLANNRWVKDKRFDPYGIYSYYKDYSGKQSETGLWLVDEAGYPLYFC